LYAASIQYLKNEGKYRCFKFRFGHGVIEELDKIPEEVINAEGINY